MRMTFSLVAVAGAVVAALVLVRSHDAGTTARAGACVDSIAAPAFRREIARVRPLVPRMKRAFAAPGLAVAVARDGRIFWSHTCGFADAARRVPVTATTQFRIGSVSKTLTAVAAARLAQAGRLDLDADVQRYVPSFPRKRGPITIRELGGHLAGIRHYAGGEAVNTKHYASVLASLRVFSRDPLVALPGERFSYSSYGFNLLGAAVAGAAGQPFAAAVDETVLRPLHLGHTRLADAPPSGATRFYEVTEQRTARPAPRVDLSDRFPSGGFLSTADDLARFGSNLGDERFLRKRTRAVLFTSQRTKAGARTGYGLGFEVRGSPFGTMAGHTGNVVGGTAFLLVNPRSRVAVAMTTNIGFVTASAPPAVDRRVPDPPQLLLPFIERARASG